MIAVPSIRWRLFPANAVLFIFQDSRFLQRTPSHEDRLALPSAPPKRYAALFEQLPIDQHAHADIAGCEMYADSFDRRDECRANRCARQWRDDD